MSWVETKRRSGRRPIEPCEVPNLEALGAELRRLREREGLSRKQLARDAMVSASTIAAIELAFRRTRETTLRALACVIADGNQATYEAITARLIDLAGPTLAPSNRFSTRREGNRVKRARRADALAARALPVAEAIADDLVREQLAGHKLVPVPARNRSKAATMPGIPTGSMRGIR